MLWSAFGCYDPKGVIQEGFIMFRSTPFLSLLAVALITACAPVQPVPIEVTKPVIMPEETKSEETKSEETKSEAIKSEAIKSESVLSDTVTKIDDSDLAPETDPQISDPVITDTKEQKVPKETETAEALDTETDEVVEAQAVIEETEAAEEATEEITIAAITPKIIETPKPAPIEPLNPLSLNGLTGAILEKRLGKADLQFTDQGVEIRNYMLPNCHIIFFIFDQGQGTKIQHIDIRHPDLTGTLSQKSCFADLGALADEQL